MTDELLEERLAFLSKSSEYKYAPMPMYKGVELPTYFSLATSYINRLKAQNKRLQNHNKRMVKWVMSHARVDEQQDLVKDFLQVFEVEV